LHERRRAGPAYQPAVARPVDRAHARLSTRSANPVDPAGPWANALADHLHRKREQELEEQHVRGYLEHPETEEELAQLEAWASLAPAVEPWE
jgi:hypothetical protein